MFRILMVDDSLADINIVKILSRAIQRPQEFYACTDGADGLDFLHGRGPYQDAPHPNLILLDVNMPGMSGFEVLAAIKGDAELAPIPVIMLSTSRLPDDVQRAYRTHANCYCEKPADFSSGERLMKAIEAFWMDAAVLPSGDEGEQPRRSIFALS